jgi:hypothetical protein
MSEDTKTVLVEASENEYSIEVALVRARGVEHVVAVEQGLEVHARRRVFRDEGSWFRQTEFLDDLIPFTEEQRAILTGLLDLGFRRLRHGRSQGETI